MGIAEYSIKNSVFSWVITLVLGLGGIMAYEGLGRLEDPEFTIKDAMVITQYPGASPQQVEEEVTYPIEKAVQQLSYVDKVTSISSRGLSQITVTMKNQYGPESLPQIWDELRRKVNDMKGQLPPGVGEPLVNDDFGDVYGVMAVVTGEEYNYRELQDYVDYVRREIELVDGVGKVSIAGAQQEQVFIELSNKKLASLGLSPESIYNLLATQNMVNPSGSVKHNQEYITFHSTGEFNDVSQLEDLIISGEDADNLIFLRDVADVKLGFQEVPSNIYRYNGQKAVNIGISFASGVNVVKIGDAIGKRMQELEFAKPLGMNITSIYNQPAEVDKSVAAFVISLAQAVGIVVVVLLFFMGLKSGILIGLILLITVLGTFVFMKGQHIELHRISLGALIIALGMLVDNAIVVTEGILIGMQRGLSKIEAAGAIVKQTMWPLLGATVIAIAAFAPIGLSDDSTGEFAGSLFSVLMISLLLSWFTAISLTPFFANLMFKEVPKSEDGKEPEDPYKGIIFVGYKALLDTAIKFRYGTIILMVGLLALAIVGFGNVKQSFFPPSTTPMFLVDYWLPQGTDIRKTYADMEDIESFILEKDVVEQVTSTTGQGAQRFMLTYEPEKMYANFGQIIVRVENSSHIKPMMAEIDEFIKTNYPDAKSKLKFLEIGPSTDAKIEARFIGPDPQILRGLAAKAMTVMEEDGSAKNLRIDWGDRSKIIEPQFNESLARRFGITRADLDQLLLQAYSGLEVGLYRDGTTLLPIIVRPPEDERVDVEGIGSLQVWSPVNQQYIPIQQIAPDYQVKWEDANIQRRYRKRVLTVLADHDVLGTETAADLFTRLRPQIEAIDLPSGYELEWGGEYESSTDASVALFGSLPMGFLTMFLITIFLFNSFGKTMVVWCTVPLAIIGITFGLLVMNESFGFMALLGMLSLSGMLLKNGIVLLDQINTELKEGTAPYKAVFMSGVSRVRPVSMAAITTILGLVPLLGDAFFVSMAVTIMFGLGFATILTLVVVPVLYVTFFRIPYQTLEQMEKS